MRWHRPSSTWSERGRAPNDRPCRAHRTPAPARLSFRQRSMRCSDRSAAAAVVVSGSIVEVALPEQQHRMRCGVGHLVQPGIAVVSERVTGLVVAGVVGRPGRSTIRRGLRRRLDPFGASEQATGRNEGTRARSDERAVVGPTVERRFFACEALRREVVGEDPLDLSRAGRPTAAPVGCRRRRTRSGRSSASQPCRSSASARFARAQSAVRSLT